MMHFGVITLFPEMFKAITHYGVSSRAFDKKLAKLDILQLRNFSQYHNKQVDDRPYGGGPGMVIQAEPLSLAIQEFRQRAEFSKALVIYFSPQGRLVTHQDIKRLLSMQQVILIAGRYKGIDERFIYKYVNEQWSLGDFVLSGGELAIMAVIDASVRLISGVLGHENSAMQDSFEDGLLDYPNYTRPKLFENIPVPQVLRSGDHDAICKWRMKQKLGKTWKCRFDLLEKISLTQTQHILLNEYIKGSRGRT